MATIKDVARAAGVGVGTASRALSGNGSVSEDTRIKIEQAAKSLGFVPNQIARNFKKQSSGCVAIIIPTIVHPFFAKIVFYCERALSARGYRLIVVNSQDDRETETRMLDMIRQQCVDGIIFITHYDHDYIDASLPIVSVDRHVGAGIPYVTSNNYEMARWSVEHLLERGAKNVGCVCGATMVESETRFRYLAYQDVMRARGLPERLMLEQFKHGQEEEVMVEFFRRYPEVDGLFTGSDMLASAAYLTAVKGGRRVPEDVQIIGFDGVLNEWGLLPRFATVRQDIHRMADAAISILMQRIAGEEVASRIEIPASFQNGETLR